MHNSLRSLRGIKSAVERVSNLVAPLVGATIGTATADIPPLELIAPSNPFEDLPLDRHAILQLKQTFERAAAASRKHCNDKYQECCRQLMATHPPPASSSKLPELFQKLRLAFQVAHERSLCAWDENVVNPFSHTVLTSRQSPPVAAPLQSTTAKKSPFHHEYVPLLEKYFAMNPFPSQTDKSLLARRSGMTYKQIGVWFQNRRSRAKRAGHLPKKLPGLELAKVAILIPEAMNDDELAHEPHDTLHHPDESEYEWEYSETETRAQSPDLGPPDLIATTSPPHAYPSAYPPICGYNPFPIKEGVRTFLPPVWRRRPTPSAEQRPMIDLDELAEEFSKLIVRDGVRRRLVKKDSRKSTAPKRNSTTLRRPDRFSATLFITPYTTPLPAPIPALIRSSPVASPSMLTHVRPSQMPTNRETTPLSPVPAIRTRETPSQTRKVAPLPKRRPTCPSTSLLGDHATPSFVSSSDGPPSPQSLISRQSSFQSECFSLTATPSESSPVSSSATTPEFSISSPAIVGEYSCLPGFLSDPFSGRLSPVSGMRLDLPFVDDLRLASDKLRFQFSVAPDTLRRGS